MGFLRNRSLVGDRHQNLATAEFVTSKQLFFKVVLVWEAWRGFRTKLYFLFTKKVQTKRAKFRCQGGPSVVVKVENKLLHAFFSCSRKNFFLFLPFQEGAESLVIGDLPHLRTLFTRQWSGISLFTDTAHYCQNEASFRSKIIP